MEPVLLVLVGLLLAVALFVLWQRFFGFVSQKPCDYEGSGRDFDIRKHLSGPIQCEGVIYGPTGRVTSRFVADFEARWDGNVGTLKEFFRYDSGATQEREWRLTIGNDGRIKAEAPDLVGAGEGWQKGSGVKLNYRIRLPEDSGGHVLDTTDWMYLVENGAIINRSQFRKFGIKVAELVATMRPKTITPAE
jgi:hypothetical protein